MIENRPGVASKIFFIKPDKEVLGFLEENIGKN